MCDVVWLVSGALKPRKSISKLSKRFRKAELNKALDVRIA